MITKEELDAMIEEKLKSLGVGSPEFIQGCKELDDMIEKAKSHSTKNKPENDFGTGGSDGAFEEETPKKIEDVQLLDDLGEIRNLLEKASNSLDNFQCRYKLMLSLDNDAETQSWFLNSVRIWNSEYLSSPTTLSLHRKSSLQSNRRTCRIM